MQRLIDLVDVPVVSEDEELYVLDMWARLDWHFEHQARERARLEAENGN